MSSQQRERPYSSRTRQKIEQVEDDQDLARLMALEEDEKIAAKLQRDIEAGLDNDDFHRLGTRGQQSTGNFEKMDFTENEGQPPQQPSSAQIDQLTKAIPTSHTQKPASPMSLKSKTNDTPAKITPPKSQPNTKNTVPPPLTDSLNSSPEPPKNGKLGRKNSNLDSQRASFNKKQAIIHQDEKSEEYTSLSKKQTSLVQDEKSEDSSSAEMAKLNSEAARLLLKEPPQNQSLFPTKSRTTDLRNLTDQETSSDSEDSQSASVTSSISSLSHRLTTKDDLQTQMATLLAFIGKYTPEQQELDQILKPFILEYIPAIGDIDPIIKVPMPETKDDKNEALETQKMAGMRTLDEPNIMQSDPAVVDLALRSLSLAEAPQEASKIRQVQIPTGLPDLSKPSAPHKSLQNWIDRVAELHLQKNTLVTSAGTSSIRGLQGDEVEKLMCEWPETVDLAISNNEIEIPTCDIDLKLKEYSQLCCNILDIPVRPARVSDKKAGKPSRQTIDSVSILMSLYLEFKNSPFARNGRQDRYI